MKVLQNKQLSPPCGDKTGRKAVLFVSFCQVVKLLGSNVQLVHKELLALLQDDALEVRYHTTANTVQPIRMHGCMLHYSMNVVYMSFLGVFWV